MSTTFPVSSSAPTARTSTEANVRPAEGELVGGTMSGTLEVGALEFEPVTWKLVDVGTNGANDGENIAEWAMGSTDVDPPKRTTVVASEVAAGDAEPVTEIAVHVSVDGANGGDIITERFLGGADAEFAKWEPVGGTMADALGVCAVEAEPVTGAVVDGTDNGNTMVKRAMGDVCVGSAVIQRDHGW